MGERKGLFTKMKEKMEEFDEKQAINSRLKNTEFFYKYAQDVLNRGSKVSRTDLNDALNSALRCCDIFDASTKYEKGNYYPLFKSQRLLSQVYTRMGDYVNADKAITNAIDSLQFVAEYNLAKGHEYVDIFGIWYEKAFVNEHLRNSQKAAQAYADFITKEDYILNDYPEEMTQSLAERITDSARMLCHYNCINIDNLYKTAYDAILCDGLDYATLASDVANYYAYSYIKQGNNDCGKVLDLVKDNYKRIKDLGNKIPNNKYHYDMAMTSCCLFALFKMSNNNQLANAVARVTISHLPEAVEKYQYNKYPGTYTDVSKDYKYIIDIMKRNYVPSLPTQNQKEVLDVLNSCDKNVATDDYEFEI